jgi:hypothetical protein
MDLIALNYPDIDPETDTETVSTVDTDAPFGRKKNGQPYKTSPAFREKMTAYSKRKYAEDPQIQYERIRKWQEKNPDKVRQYAHQSYYKKQAELQYYKELFQLGLETP